MTHWAIIELCGATLSLRHLCSGMSTAMCIHGIIPGTDLHKLFR